MARIYSIFFSSIYLVIQLFSLSVKGHRLLAPALYVFGDSLVDSGNNNYLQTQAKANYKPYGIDFPLGVTGRFTNGKTAVDFIAESLGLPYVPPYLALSEGNKSKTIRGVNYASGSAGILRETGTAGGKNLCLDDQVKYFQGTLANDLPKNIKTPAKLHKYLAKSIFVIMIGSNDYINNYLQPSKYNSSRIYTPQQFATLLIQDLKQRMMELYNLGARKFVLFGLGPIGCLPAIVNNANPRPNTTCIEAVNNYIIIFNRRLPGMIRELKSTLHQSTFIFGDVYETSYQTNINPSEFGFTGGGTPCCVVGGNGTTACLPNQIPCKDRSKNLYYDAFHPSEVVNKNFAMPCFNESSPCIPINIHQLVRK